MLEDFYPDPDNAGENNPLGRQALGRMVLGRRFPLATPPFLPARVPLANSLGGIRVPAGVRIPLDEQPPTPTRGIQAPPIQRATGLAPELGRAGANRAIDLEPDNLDPGTRAAARSGLNGELGVENLPITGRNLTPLETAMPPGGVEPKLGTGAKVGLESTPQLGPATQRLRTLLAEGEPQVKPLHGWKRGLEIAGEILAPRVVNEIEQFRHEPQLRYEQELGSAEKAAQAEQGLGLNAARLDQLGAETAADRARLATEQQRLDNLKRGPADKMLTHGIDEQGNAVVTFQRPDGSVYTEKAGYRPQVKTTTAKILTNPFEAFAYGTPEQKKAAQNFLSFEKSIGARYRQPSELDERYRLYKHDPKAYAAMFGTKGNGGISQATATKMLNYFDRRRREVTDDFMLSDAEKKQKLAEIQQLEQPFMDAAHGIQSGSGGSGQSDTVTVINPQGQLGTIPQANLSKALKRGYKLANQ